MTYKEFYRELRALRGSYKLDAGKMIRSCEKGVGYCPIVGVSLKHNGPECYEDGGLKLGLRPNQISVIADAADNELSTDTRRKVRKSLLRVLGLKEVK